MKEAQTQENVQLDREADPEFLSFKIKYFERLKNGALYRQERLSKLMGRQGAQKWKPEKVAKMTRRFVATQEMIKAAEQAIAETGAKISALTHAHVLTNEVPGNTVTPIVVSSTP